jgi:hypothetical protein
LASTIEIPAMHILLDTTIVIRFTPVHLLLYAGVYFWHPTGICC